jgi:hypothetical protein
MSKTKQRTDREGRRLAFIGAYVPEELKRAVEDKARREFRTVSQEVARVLTASLNDGARVQAGEVQK